MAVTSSNNCMHLPISQAMASVYGSGSLVDAYPILDLPTPIIAPIALPSLFVAS